MKTNEEVEEDNFKPVFKYYKSKKPPPQLDQVLDPRNPIEGQSLLKLVRSNGYLVKHVHLTDSKSWKILRMEKGIHVIRNPFKSEGISFWTQRCLQDFSKSVNNIQNSDWYCDVQKNPRLLDKLRWATLGYHHDWNTKEYKTDQKDWNFPPDLGELCQILLRQIPEFEELDYKAQAAIVNFYPLDATLSGHVDFSEPNKEAPLVSISLGQSAIFLIGGPSKKERPDAIFLRNGDVLVMSHQARQSYHAVPKILKCDEEFSEDDVFCNKYLTSHRINLNVRQVF